MWSPPIPALLRNHVPSDCPKTISLPHLSRPPIRATHDFSSAGGARRDFELVLWLCLFSCSRLHPVYSSSSNDDERRSSASPSYSSPLAHGSFPGSMRSVTPSAFATAAHDKTSTESGDRDLLADNVTEVEASDYGGDATLPFSRPHCQRAIRGFCSLLSLRKDQLAFNGEQLYKWATSPQQFGVAVRKREELAAIPPDDRQRRDRVYRSVVLNIIGDESCLWYLWWCAGMYAPIRSRESLLPIGTGGALSLNSFSQSPFGSFGRRTLIDSPVSAQSEARSTRFSFSSRGRLPPALLMQPQSGSSDNEEAMAISEMCKQLLLGYVEGTVSLMDEFSQVSMVVTGTQSLCLAHEQISSIPFSLIRLTTCALAVTHISVVECGLLSADGLEECGQLRSVRLAGNRLRQLPRNMLRQCRHLQVLELDGNLIEDFMDNEDNITALRGEGSLERLSLPFNCLTNDSVLKFLSAQHSTTTLTWMDLSGNGRLTQPFPSLKALHECFPRLTKLTLRQLHNLDQRLIVETSTFTIPGLQVMLPAVPVFRFTERGVIQPAVINGPPGNVRSLRRRRWRLAIQYVRIVIFLFNELMRISSAKSLAQLQGASAQSVAMCISQEERNKRAHVETLRDRTLRCSHGAGHLLSGPQTLPPLSSEAERILSRYSSRRATMKRKMTLEGSASSR